MGFGEVVFVPPSSPFPWRHACSTPEALNLWNFEEPEAVLVDLGSSWKAEVSVAVKVVGPCGPDRLRPLPTLS